MISVHFIKKNFIFFKLFTSKSQKKSNDKKNHAYLTGSQYARYLLKKYSRLQNFSQSRHLQDCKTSEFFFWFMFLISSPPSTTALRFPHFLWMNTSLGKSSKFPISYLSMPSSLSSTIITFSEWCFYSNML